MTRLSFLSFGLLALVVFSGCSVVETQRYPTPRRGGTVYRPADHRADRYEARHTADQRRVRRDVREYVRFLDRELRLSERQEYRITEILENRTYKLLQERRGQYRDAYPFPRSFRSRAYQSRTAERFWHDADRRVERVLDRRQAREYRDLTDGRPRDRYRDDRRDRDDDRYDNRRDRRDDRRDRRRRGRDRD